MADETTPDAAPTPPAIDRRDALKAIAVAAAAATLTDAANPVTAEAQARAARTLPTAPAPKSGPRGTPTDPDLLNARATWPMQLTAAELVTLSALVDVIIPADDKSPAASTVGVPAYINEYVSAPYDWAESALIRVRGGLVWLDVESTKRFGKRFTALSLAEKSQICDDICYLPTAKKEFQSAARFFDAVRDLAAVGFYTTDAGMKDIGYVGNVPLVKFEGPPPHVLKHVGLA
jgi:gluconate 2-dehydrogenase gamma chain